MRPVLDHPWNLSPAEAIALQLDLRKRVDCTDHPLRLGHVAGIDVGFEDGGRTTRAAVVVLDYPGLRLVEQAVARRPTDFPYVPGLLSFRELPAVLEALTRLTVVPDVILCDGQGIAHPRRFGIASHLGVLLDAPTIGVGKTRLCGRHEEPGNEKGAWAPLQDGGEIIGVVLRTRAGVKPVYVSIGHKLSLTSAIRIVLACTPRYRLPETIRQAHRLASQTN
ncbi:endonuclease V [Sulfuritortus calidifontis]|uniref:Endonuclease V n=1 Tax=Sulfuritortus calidifontis TaxID=1914471 RepID=A0A4R3JZY3_9PROT|nr:deoxyribonuclease V [Sulfuritortus calidifontis]TCS73062.1 endonuclease V [Sulfuritortus calidifontis]